MGGPISMSSGNKIFATLPDEAQPVQPAPQHKPLIASDEKTNV